MQEYLSYMRDTKGVAENTLQAYRNDLKKLFAFFEKQNLYAMDKVSETTLTSYVLMLEREGRSPATVSRNIAVIKSFFLYLIKQGRVKIDPSERIKPPKIQRKPPKSVDEKRIEDFLELPNQNSWKGKRDKAILELLYATGIKATELISLRMDGLHLASGYLICGERKERTIPLGGEVRKALKEYLEIRVETDKILEPEFLFLNQQGRRISRQGLWKILRSYANKLGLEGINPNVLRHSFATHMVNHGADLGTIQELLGFADISAAQIYHKENHKNSREVYMNTHPRA